MSDLVSVVYIGDKPEKHDNVLRKPRVWKGRGTVVKCPADEAAVYFTYEDIWAPEDVAAKIIRKKMSVSEKPKAAEKQPKAPPKQVEVDTSERAALIQGAILQLDPKNDAHYTEQGKPRVKAVVDVIGFSVEAADIDNALNDLRAAGKLQ